MRKKPQRKRVMETRQQVTQRKIRNGLRKQADMILREKSKIWDILKQEPKPAWKFVELSKGGGYFNCPGMPISTPGVEPVIKNNYVSKGETT